MSWANRRAWDDVSEITPMPTEPFSSKSPGLIRLEKEKPPTEGKSSKQVKLPADAPPYMARFTVMDGCNSQFDSKGDIGWTWPVLAITDPDTQKTYYFVGAPGLRCLCAPPHSIDYWHNNVPFANRKQHTDDDTEPVYFDPPTARNFYTHICPCPDVLDNFHAPLVQLDEGLWRAFVANEPSKLGTLSQLCERLRRTVSGKDDDPTVYNSTTLLTAEYDKDALIRV